LITLQIKPSSLGTTPQLFKSTAATAKKSKY
jgi:hypothetical protein